MGEGRDVGGDVSEVFIVFVEEERKLISFFSIGKIWVNYLIFIYI